MRAASGNVNISNDSANLNSANYLYWRGELDAALPFARRLVEMEERYLQQEGLRSEGAVLLARILWSRGDEAEARQLVQDTQRRQADVRGKGLSNLLLAPNDELLLDMTALLVEGADAVRWEEVVDRSRRVAQGQELIEVLELAGVAALARNEQEGARRCWLEALEAGERIGNVMDERIRGRLRALG